MPKMKDGFLSVMLCLGGKGLGTQESYSFEWEVFKHLGRIFGDHMQTCNLGKGP